ncbi:MAG: hypothetical protein M3P30_04885 [Chloroflexota bacterium]|nr:hypothetical protein [Chloroflexota bacterium]
MPTITITVNGDAEAKLILAGCGSSDSSVRLACQLLVAKLNLKSGSAYLPNGDPLCILVSITSADGALRSSGYNTKPSGATRQVELDLAMKLAFWNKNGTCM